jgi:hypothetical protein
MPGGNVPVRADLDKRSSGLDSWSLGRRTGMVGHGADELRGQRPSNSDCPVTSRWNPRSRRRTGFSPSCASGVPADGHVVHPATASPAGNVSSVQFGLSSDIPLGARCRRQPIVPVSDFDGDGVSEHHRLSVRLQRRGLRAFRPTGFSPPTRPTRGAPTGGGGGRSVNGRLRRRPTHRPLRFITAPPRVEWFHPQSRDAHCATRPGASLAIGRCRRTYDGDGRNGPGRSSGRPPRRWFIAYSSNAPSAEGAVGPGRGSAVRERLRRRTAGATSRSNRPSTGQWFPAPEHHPRSGRPSVRTWGTARDVPIAGRLRRRWPHRDRGLFPSVDGRVGYRQRRVDGRIRAQPAMGPSTVTSPRAARLRTATA